MAPIKSSLARSVSKLLGVSVDRDKSLRGYRQSSRLEAKSIEYIVLAGGGGGGFDAGGGGGAGGYRTGTTPIGAHPVSTTVQVGAGGASTLSLIHI